jgi:hypothetical protein
LEVKVGLKTMCMAQIMSWKWKKMDGF